MNLQNYEWLFWVKTVWKLSTFLYIFTVDRTDYSDPSEFHSMPQTTGQQLLPTASSPDSVTIGYGSCLKESLISPDTVFIDQNL
jgi:hypothetical protein